MSKALLFKVTGDTLNLFGPDKMKRGGGWNFRMRYVGNVISFKPSSRPAVVDGESFGTLDQKTNEGIFAALEGMSGGTFATKKLNKGWHELVADKNGTVHIEATEQTIEPKQRKKRAPRASAEASAAPAEPVAQEPREVEMTGEEACQHLNITPAQLRKQVQAGEIRSRGTKIIVMVGAPVMQQAA